MSDDDCLFCKIRDGKIPSAITYRDDDVFAFKDIGPKAPLHELVVPTRHVASLADATAEDGASTRSDTPRFLARSGLASRSCSNNSAIPTKTYGNIST